jgi:hypothetical protein
MDQQLQQELAVYSALALWRTFTVNRSFLATSRCLNTLVACLCRIRMMCRLSGSKCGKPRAFGPVLGRFYVGRILCLVLVPSSTRRSSKPSSYTEARHGTLQNLPWLSWRGFIFVWGIGWHRGTNQGGAPIVFGLSQVGRCFGGVQDADNCGVHPQMP